MKKYFLLNLSYFLILIRLSAQNSTDATNVNSHDTSNFKGYSIEILGSPLFYNNMYTKTTLTQYKGTSPEKMSNSKIGYLTGFRAGYINNNWLYQSGIIYSTFQESFNTTDTSYLSNKDTNNIIVTNITKDNFYQYLYVPLEIGYINKIKKITLIIKAGVNLGFNIYKEGLTYDFSVKKQIPLYDNYNGFEFQYSLSATIKYQLNDNINLIAEPFYTSGMNSLWKESPVFAWKRNQYGCYLGIEFLIREKEYTE